MRKSFTWFLGLMVLLTSFATHAVAQETQETVELYAEDASYCYDEANDYTVTIAVRDFIKLTSFELNLVYNDAIYEYTGFSSVHTSLAGVDDSNSSAGIITLEWDDAATTIGNNVKTDVIELYFSVVGFPGSVVSPLESDLAWGTTNFYYTTTSGTDNVNTDESFDGSLTLNVAAEEIETSIAAETCAGGDVTLTVTAPDVDMYLFNEDPDPANWAWSNSPDFQASAGDVVTVRVKDADGCISVMESVTIPETLDPVAFTVAAQDPACYGGKGSVVVSASGGTGPYTYYISPNSDGTDAVTKTNFQWAQAPGTYYIAVQDANDCADIGNTSYWQTITIEDNNAEVTGSVAVTDVTCNGADDGVLVVTVDQADADNMYQVSLNGGLTWGDAGTYSFDELPGGDYNVKVRDADGCVVTINDAVTITEPNAITFDLAVVDVACGDANDGEIQVSNITGGTSPYTLVIEEDGTTTTETGVTTGYDFTGLMPTYYSLTITDVNGCSVEYSNPNGTGNVIAVQSPDDINFDVEITDPICMDGDASVEITNVTGGTGSYVYSFDGGTTWVDTMTIDSWPAPYTGTTVVVANEDESCPVSQAIDATDVDNPTELMVDVDGVFPPTCIDGNDGNIYLNISGGVEPYYYSINGSSWRESNYDNLAIIRVGVGTHNIMVRDSAGCEYSTTITEDVTLEESTITATSDVVIDCYGGKTGTISVDYTNWAGGLTGTEPNRSVSYWVEDLSDNSTTGFTPSNHVPSGDDAAATTFSAGEYVVWVVDQYTCESNTDTVEVLQNAELMIEDVVANGASCFGSFEGTITIHATGGNTNNLEYAVVNNQGALGNIADDKWLLFEEYVADGDLSTVSFQVDAGTYWIAVRDNGCDVENFGPIEVEGYEELLVAEDDIMPEDPLCYQDSNGVITVPMDAVSGGAGSYLFTLLDDAGDEIEGYIDLATGDFTDLKAGTYTVLVEDAEDCPAYETADIVLTEPTELTSSTTFQHISCVGANDGLITVTANGGTGQYSYAINNQNTWVAFAEDSNTKTYIATEPGTFRVWVKDENGCIAGPDTVTIMEPTELSADIDVDSVSCYGGADGEITVTGTGGWTDVTTYEFKLNDGAWTTSTTFSNLGAGADTLYIRDAFASYGVGDYDTLQALDCNGMVIFSVEQPDPIVYEVYVNDVKCKDGADGTMTVEIISGGTPFVDEDGDDDGFLVNVTGPAYDETFYTGDDNELTLDNLAHGIYSVYITDAEGCTLAPTVGDDDGPYTTIESWEVAEPDTYLDVEAMFEQDATCYGAEDGQFTVEATGGTEPYMYAASLSVEPDGHVLVPEAPAEDSDEWQDTTVFNVGAGTWVVWVMDANGCIVGGQTNSMGVPVNEWRVKIAQPEEIMWDFHTVEVEGEDVVHYAAPKCYGSWDGAIHIETIDGGSGSYNAHVWGTSADGMMVDTTYMGIEAEGSANLYWLRGVPASDTVGFEVTVIDSLNGCESAVDTIVVEQPEELMVDLVTAEGSFTCVGAVEGFIEVNATGGNGDYEYQLWKNDAIHTPWQDAASAYLVQVGNTFVVEVRDESGCTATDTIYIETPLDVEFEVMDLTCSGAEMASARVIAQGTPDRMFRVIYEELEDDIAVETDTSDWFESSIDLMNEFVFDSENFNDVHYLLTVEDEVGCKSVVDTVTFDATDVDPVEVIVDEGDVTECYEEVTFSVFGGVKPYTVMVNDSVLTDMTYQLPRGQNIVTVMDAHECEVTQIIDVTGNYVTRDTTIETFVGYETEFVDEEAGVDTMIAVGVHQWMYVYEDCERTLNVTVVEVPRPLTIAEIQGEEDDTPWNEEVVVITGTVTGVSANEGFFMQDANDAWSGIWVAWTDTDGLEIGDGVEVEGEVGEVSDVTTISATDVTEMDAELTVEPIIVANPLDVESEMYESVLITIEGGRATEVDAVSGEWTVYYDAVEDAVINDLLYNFTPVAGTFYDVTGIVNGRLEAFSVEPRMEEDIIDLGATPVEPELEFVKFKVYPNPFNDRIYIDNHDKLTRVVISNVAGQRVLDVEYPNNEIRTAKLVSGVYIVSMFTEDGITKSERIVKR